jgi:Asp-tRNA(Asn)/Glu-tRNA(Gln) amidotransferase A subunit family amidase
MSCELTASQAARAIASGSLSSEELVRSCLDRISSREPQVRAFAHVAAERALKAARDADTALLATGTPIGPLHGVPFAVKDVIDSGDMPTQYNSRIYRDFQPAQDAACVSILRSAGAILLGKTETIEFAAHGRLPGTRNPVDLARTPGGSSSGSGAAVADGMVPLALGTQTGGSLIRPASYTGVFAMKPTFGTVSTEGAKTFAPSLDTIGWYARSLEDLQLVAEIFELWDQPPAAIERPLTLGLVRTPYWDRASADARDAIAAAVARLEGAGHTVRSVELGSAFADIDALKGTIMLGEGRVSFLNLWLSIPEKLSPGIVRRMARGSNRNLCAALDRAAALRLAFDAIASPYDAMLAPAATGVAPLGIAYSGDPIFNSLWTLLNLPCLSLPVLDGEHGLPIGLQMVGPRYADAALLAAARVVLSVLSTASEPSRPPLADAADL